jgi:hypothetical protein
MKAFGEGWFPVEMERTETPVGVLCLYCQEPIAEGDQGVLMPYLGNDGVSEVAEHRACLVRMTIGSVGHLKRTCSCYGGTEEDPPELTRRQGAEAALLYLLTEKQPKH